MLNARAAGLVVLCHGRHTDSYTVRQAPTTEAVPILKLYVEVASATRSYYWR